LDPELLEATLPHTVARRKVGRFLLVAPFVFRAAAELPAVPDPREAVEAVWVPLRVLLDPARHYLGCVPGRPAFMLYPVIDLNVAPLWGFTYRLITDWLGLVPQGMAAERAGFQIARHALGFLLSHGLVPEREWQDSGAEPETGQVVKIARVRGVIPVAAALAHFSAPGPAVPCVSVLEVRPDSIRVTGLAFEEYVIQAS
jgi:hypothetical protein